MRLQDDASRVGRHCRHPKGYGEASAETRLAQSPRYTQEASAHHCVPYGEAES